jgi:hypothetical protein
MAEETFRQERKKITQDELNSGNKMEEVIAMQKAVENELHESKPEPSPLARGDGGFQIQGNAPKAFMDAMKGKGSPVATQQRREISGSPQLKELLEGLKDSTAVFESIQLPSKGRFYDGTNGPIDGILNIRPMTGEEEQILATPRFVKKGQAINMIFSRCIRDNIKSDYLLTVDRTYLLIYLRGISYSPEYEVEIKCAECDRKFSTVIDLNSLFVETCPDNFGPNLEDELPTSKYKFSYRLSNGRDEIELQEYRDRRIKMFGDSAADDTLTYRTAMLVDNIQGLTDKRDLQTLVKNLPINDVSYLRNCINEPPFGVETKVEMNCPSCLHDFSIELPLESGFFFPRKKIKRE